MICTLYNVLHGISLQGRAGRGINLDPPCPIYGWVRPLPAQVGPGRVSRIGPLAIPICDSFLLCLGFVILHLRLLVCDLMGWFLAGTEWLLVIPLNLGEIVKYCGEFIKFHLIIAVFCSYFEFHRS